MVVDFGRKLDTLVTDCAADHHRMYACLAHLPDKRVPEVVPAANLYANRVCSRVQIAKAGYEIVGILSEEIQMRKPATEN